MNSKSTNEKLADPQKILQELRIHQAELEMQNEELRQAQSELQVAKDLYIDLYELAPVGYCTLSDKGKILQANLTTTTLLSSARETLINHHLHEFILSEDQDIFYLHLKQLNSTHKTQSCDLRMVKSDGITFWAHLESSIAQDSMGQWIMHLVISDITESKQTQSELRIAAIAFESQNGIVITDPHCIILRTNEAFSRITGYSAEEAKGQTLALIKSGRHNEAFYQYMWSVLNKKGRWQGEIWNKRKNGEIYVELLTITAVNANGSGVTHYVGNFSDITEDKEAEEVIHRLAYYDPLTGLPNRRLLQDKIGQAIVNATQTGIYGAILFIDIDHFKVLNDTRGHAVGDLLLIEIAHRLRTSVRATDTVGRQGGDEFVVILDNLSHNIKEATQMAKHLGDKVREIIDLPFDLNGIEYHCKISVGVSLLYKDDTIEDILKHSDLALYQAKNAGRNTLRFFDPAMQDALNYLSSLELELRQAIKLKQFCLYYQPQVDNMGLVIGVEALIRWKHPERGLIPPNDFIPLAEDTGLILDIGHWVLNTACEQLKEWAKNKKLRSLKIAVNVSAKEFRQITYVHQVKKVLKDNGINPELIKLELTESLILENIHDAILKMNELKTIGISFSMDDFGTGYSSLSYLAQLPLDQLKIDKSFVDNIPGEKNDEMITRTIIAMGKGLEMNVISEGVETKAQWKLLETFGCNTYQGYFFSKPLPVQELEAFLTRGAKKLIR